MATLDWPVGEGFRPSAVAWSARAPRSSWQGFYTGQRQSISHAAERLLCTLTLPPVGDRTAAAAREAWVLEVMSAGHWVRLRHPHRATPRGTLRGTPTMAAAAAAGARTISVQGTAGATLMAGDLLGVAGALAMVGIGGAAALGSVLTVPLAVPLVRAAAAGSAVTWLQPTAEFQLEGQPRLAYGDGLLQEELELDFVQVVA